MIYDLSAMLEDFVQMRTLFDPEKTLQKLYDYEAILSQPEGCLVPSVSPSSNAPRRYGADDYDSIDDY